MPAQCCTLNVYFASHTTHTLTHNMAACTWQPWTENSITSLHHIYMYIMLLAISGQLKLVYAEMGFLEPTLSLASLNNSRLSIQQ